MALKHKTPDYWKAYAKKTHVCNDACFTLSLRQIRKESGFLSQAETKGHWQSKCQSEFARIIASSRHIWWDQVRTETTGAFPSQLEQECCCSMFTVQSRLHCLASQTLTVCVLSCSSDTLQCFVSVKVHCCSVITQCQTLVNPGMPEHPEGPSWEDWRSVFFSRFNFS